MRKFTSEELDLIRDCKWNVRKSDGETWSLDCHRYRRTSIGHLPGTWFKTDASIKFEMEIIPGKKGELRFIVSGMTPSFEAGKAPSISLTTMLDTTVNYTAGKHMRMDDAGELFREATDTEELRAVLDKFFNLAEDMNAGYSYLILGMKQGYRFSGVKEWSWYSAYDEEIPEHLFK